MDTSGWTRRAAAATLALLTAAVAVLAVVASRLSSRVAELESRPAAPAPASVPAPAPARDEGLKDRAAALERERDELTDENRALRAALRGTATPSGPPPAAGRPETMVADEARALRVRASVAEAEGRWRDARLALGQAVALDATDARSWAALSVAGFASGAWREAGEAFTRALGLGWRELFGAEAAPSLRFRSREEYERLLRGLEEHAAATPSDLHARTLLAWHLWFERGANVAQVVLAEILQSPGGMDFTPAKTLSREMSR